MENVELPSTGRPSPINTSIGEPSPTEETNLSDARDRASWLSRHWIAVTLGLVILLGATLRFTGVNWDESQHLHPDERFLTMVETAISFPGGKNIQGELPEGCKTWGGYFDTVCSPLNPYNRNFGSFVYGTFPLILTRFVGERAQDVGGFLRANFFENGLDDAPPAVAAVVQTLVDGAGYEGVALIGRVLSGIIDLMTVILVFLIARKLFDSRVGLLAAFFLSITVLNIQQSHFFTVDTFTNLPVVLAVYFAIDISERGVSKIADALVAGVTALFVALSVDLAQGPTLSRLSGFGNIIAVVTILVAAGLIGFVTAKILRALNAQAFALAGASLGLAVAGRINMVMLAAIIVVAAVLHIIRVLEDLDTDVSVSRRHPAGFPDETMGSRSAASLSSRGEQDGLGTPIGLSPAALDLASSRGGEGALVARSSASLQADRSSRNLDDVRTEKTFTLGPLSVEIRYKEQSGITVGGLFAQSFVGLIVSALVALLVFRVAQPYAFKGLVGLNPKFLDDMKFISQLISGEIDYPPSHQWTDRIPYLFPLYNIFNYGMGFPLALAGWAGFIVGLYQLIRYRNWNHLLLVLWIGGFFLYQGQQFVKVIRYFLPIYPFLIIYAAYFIFWLWDHAKKLSAPQWRTIAKIATVAFAAIVIGYTTFWAFAFTSIYTRPVSRVAASHWIVHNIPPGSVIANEHWDDPLPLRVEGLDPFGGMFKGLSSSSDGEIQNYGEDTPEKRDQMLSWLDEADYIVLSSNRLYQSIPRLPLRYPLTTKYYDWLFNGQLGFEQIRSFTSYPQLFGIVINDDNSDEAFTVYDHPKVLIFQKTPAYSSENTKKLIDSVDLNEVLRLKPIDATASRGGYRLSPQDLLVQRAGGTWSEIFNPEDIVNRIPVLVWIALIFFLGIAAFPVTSLLFRGFADKGYAFAKALGILAMTWLAWSAAGYHLLEFSNESILLMLALFLVLNVVVAVRNWRELWAYIQTHFDILIVEEAVYLSAFAFFLLIRFGNPDLWHPYFGGEKPMDFAYLNASIKSSTFPPYNPWFAGNFINYYYFGQIISATLVKLTGIVPEVAYNLLLPMFFGLTASGAFGVAYNLVQAAGTKKSASSDSTADSDNLIDAASPAPLTAEPKRFLLSIRAVAAGIMSAFLVLVIGNLGQVGVLGKGLVDLGQQSNPDIKGWLAVIPGLFAWLVERKELPVAIGNWYWTATRVIPDTINEFPFFTFLYADLHAHLMSLPYTLVALGLALHAVLNRARLKWYDLAGVALVLGALRAINTWDYPTYLAIIGAAMVVGFFIERRAISGEGFDWRETLQRYLLFIVIAFVQVALLVIPINALGPRVTIDVAIYGLIVVFGIVLGFALVGFTLDPRQLLNSVGWRMIAIIALSVLLYWPYVYNYGTAYTSAELWKDQHTSLPDYLIVHGIFLFMIATYLCVRAFGKEPNSKPSEGDVAPTWYDNWIIYLLPGFFILEVAFIFLGFAVFALLLPLLAIGVGLVLRKDSSPEHRFIALLMVAGMLMTLMVEVVTLKGDIGRMNTVFKFYLQAWVLFGVSSAAGLMLIFDHLRFARPVAPATSETVPSARASYLAWLKPAWWGVLGLLIAAGLLYPLFATWAKVNDRYVAGSPPGLNGMDYMQGATYNESNHELALDQDYRAINWLRQNIKGSPVFVEGNTGLYHWGDRVSIYTGLPTIIGWDWHTKQQYSVLPGDIVDHRIQDVKTIYETTDPNEALNLMKEYGASYIYIGGLERAVYNNDGLSKFEAMAETGKINKVYDADGVQIYQVPSTDSALAK